MAGDLEAKAFIKRGKHLVPADFVAEEFIDSIPEGKEILVTARTPRHPGNHRHFFAILRLASEHLPDYPDEETLLDALKIAVGHVRPVMKADGEMIFLPKSINFASLGEDAFRRFKNRALWVLSRILGFDAVSLLPEIDERNRRTTSGWPSNDGPPLDDRPQPPTSAYEE
jgi:hypothetical protein